MTDKAPSARILVVSNAVADADDVVRVLSADWQDVQTSSQSAQTVDAVAAFETLMPAVVVLAYRTVELAERYCLGLYRLRSKTAAHPYKTVLLCSRDDVAAAFQRCKDGVFDDYVPYWPLSHDGLRLRMSVFNAAREIASLAYRPSREQLLAHSANIHALNCRLADQVAAGHAHADRARQGLKQVQTRVASAFAALIGAREESVIAADDQDGAAASARDHRTGLQGDLLPRIFDDHAAALEPLAAWPAEVEQVLAAHVSHLDALTHRVRAAARVILVIDDDEFARSTIANTVSMQGDYEIRFAENATAALSMLRDEPPHLILMDIKLPDVDGITLTRQLKASPQFARIPVLMLTGESHRDAVEGSLNAGAVGFIVKPFTSAALLSKINHLLATAR